MSWESHPDAAEYAAEAIHQTEALTGETLPAVIDQTPDTARPVGKAPVAFEQLRQALLELDDQRQTLEAEGDYASLIVGLDALNTLRRDLGVLATAIEHSALETMPGKRVELHENDLVAEKHWKAGKTVWDPAPLLARVIRTAVDPDGTGELPAPGEILERVEKALTSTAGLTPSHGWRVTGLKALGIDPGDYREQEGGRYQLSIIGGDQ